MPHKILFLTDHIPNGRAASETGYKVCLVLREKENSPSDEFVSIKNLTDLLLNTMNDDNESKK